MRLLIYEYVSGGGYAEEPIPSSVLSEGFGMLRTLVSDFKAAGHHVTTILDSRLAKLNPPLTADCVLPVFSRRKAQEVVRKSSEASNAAYVIAPETDGILQSLVESVEQTGAVSLNCPSRTIEKVANKAVLHEHLGRLGLPSPETLIFGARDDISELKRTVAGKLSFPVVFKPLDGVGCAGLSIVKNQDQVVDAVEKIAKETSSNTFLVQEYLEGVAASVSLISTGDKALPLSLNKQNVVMESPEAISSYTGGFVPLDSPLRSEAFALAEKIVASFRELRGYVGVDLVLTEKEPVALEVNPRLTTSYVGLSRIVSVNVAQAMMNAVLDHKLPTNLQHCGYAYFSKIEAPNPTLTALQETYKLNAVVSPPFPVSGNGAACALVASEGATLKEAMLRFREAKKRFHNTMNKKE